MPIEVPRDRNGSFEPKIVPKGQTRLSSFNEKILSLYARGLTTREIQQHIEEIYKVEVSPTLISNVTEAVMEDVVAWQTARSSYLSQVVVQSQEKPLIYVIV